MCSYSPTCAATAAGRAGHATEHAIGPVIPSVDEMWDSLRLVGEIGLSAGKCAADSPVMHSVESVVTELPGRKKIARCPY